MGDLVPNSEEDVAAAVREAGRRRRTLSIRGGGTRIAPRSDADVLDTTGLSGITLYEPGALTLVARAGTPLAEVEAALAAENQHLPFEPWDARSVTGRNGVPTIGGAVATNASGPRRLQAGACRDSLIGVRFVDGAGSVIKNGGRVMKNVTGLDLVKLMCGSRGTLGVLTEVAFKVLPKPEATATVILDGLAPDDAVAAMAAALATPFEVTAAAFAPSGFGDGSVTALRLEGFVDQVAYRSRALADALAGQGAARIEDGPWEWPKVRDGAVFAGRDGTVWRVSVKPGDGPRVARAIAPAEVILDWAGGLVWALAPDDLDVRAAMAGIGGHATIVNAGGEVPWPLVQPEPAPVAALADGLRARFDPHGILNPGLMAAAAAPVPA